MYALTEIWGGAMSTDTDAVGIIWNPSKTDRETLEHALDAVWEASSQTRRDVAWFDTSKTNTGQELAAQAIAAGCTTLIAAGGDGTVREVAEHLAHAASLDGPPASLGIVPLGTGNLLARNLGVPLNNVRAAFTRILTSEASPLDAGTVRLTDTEGASRELVFTVMVGFGIDAQMIEQTDDELKSKAGWLAYVESLGRAMSEAKVTEFTMQAEGADARPDAAHTLIIGNCGSIQGGVVLLPDAVPDDGKLDLLALRADGVGSWLDTMRNMVWENGIMRAFQGDEGASSSASTGHLQARSFDVELASPQRFQVDGDALGTVTSFSVSVQPSALRVH